MTAGKPPVPRLWVLLLACAGIAVVALSWMTPESGPQRPAPEATYQQTSYSGCAQDLAPDYGVRSVSDIHCIR